MGPCVRGERVVEITLAVWLDISGRPGVPTGLERPAEGKEPQLPSLRQNREICHLRPRRDSRGPAVGLQVATLRCCAAPKLPKLCSVGLQTSAGVHKAPSDAEQEAALTEGCWCLYARFYG